jgi:8-oxo-dGTP diphosphatase
MTKFKRTRIAAYALILDNKKILLCRISRALPRWQGSWTLPGGGIDFGEHPQSAVIREVFEETGLQVKVDEIAFVDSIVDYSGEDDFHGIRIAYYVSVVGGTLEFEQSGSTDRCEWLSIQELRDKPLVDLAQTAFDFLKRLEKL